MTHKFDINTLSLQQPVEKSRLFYLLIKVRTTKTSGLGEVLFPDGGAAHE